MIKVTEGQDRENYTDNQDRESYSIEEEEEEKEEDDKQKRLDELEQKAWENMTGEDVANNLSKEEAEEYYKLLGE